MEIKQVKVPATFKADGPEGSVQAVFSTFNVIDKGGDIVLASAFTHGQAVPMTWSHDWSRPIGKGMILVEAERAIFDGQFFLDTAAGAEAYKTVKNLGPLQEWSWGFKVTDAAFEQRDGEYVRLIKGADVFEVAPVLVGEGENTHTLAIKGAQPYSDEVAAALAAAEAVVARSKSLADLRAKEGRTLSSANRDRLANLKTSLAAIIADLDELLAATEPEKSVDVLALYTAYQRTLATLNGVATN